MTYKSYETERLYLIPTVEADAAFVLALLNSPKWKANIGDRNVNNLAEAEEYIKERMLPQLNRLGFGNYTVVRKSDGAKMGTCGLYDREGLEGVDIGFAFLPAYEKMGYAFEAASKIKDLAFFEFGLTMIKGITLPANKASQRLLEKLDLVFIKMIRVENDDEELMLYQLEKDYLWRKIRNFDALIP